jgi:hypothetical protein
MIYLQNLSAGRARRSDSVTEVAHLDPIGPESLGGRFRRQSENRPVVKALLLDASLSPPVCSVLFILDMLRIIEIRNSGVNFLLNQSVLIFTNKLERDGCLPAVNTSRLRHSS